MVMIPHYIPSLVVLSFVVAALASYVALSLAYNVTNSKGKTQAFWLAGGALALGVGIWSMHFVGMLAFEMPGMEMAYDIPLMVLSIVVAIFGSALALFVVSRPSVHSGSMVLGGVAMAAAINGMHYIGMYSMRMSARIEWNAFLVVISILIALVASFAALTISIKLRNKQEGTAILVLASLFMGVAIAGMHYTGMAAATFVHDDSIQIHNSNLLVTTGLSWAVSSLAFLILACALVLSVGQRLLAFRQKRTDEVLVRSEARFRLLVEAVKDYAIFMIDTRGFITTWNSGAQKITGYSAEEIVGKHVSTFYNEDDLLRKATEKELVTATDTGHFEGEAIRVRKDGTIFWANIVIDPLYDKEGRITGFSKVIRDITALKDAETRMKTINEELEKRVDERTLALQERELQLRTITNAIPVLVAQVDRFERMLFANNSFCDWFECLPNKIQDRTFRELLGEERYPSNKIYIDKVFSGETVTYQRESQSRGRTAILDITFVPEFDSAKYVKGFIIVATDVRKYKEIEKELKNAKDAAEVANETKSAFLANMSHEIRTPLGAIIGFSELVSGDEISQSERLNHIEVIKRNGKLLSTIINDILDLSKVEAGKLEIEKTNVQLTEVLNEIAVLLNLEASGKGIKLGISADGPIPSTVTTDPTRLRQILFNIIGNAIKFTDRGSVNVIVRLAPNDPSKVAFYVQDTGTGISPEQSSRLFSPFTQADVTTTRKFGGTGLGLVLSKKLANALGGDVTLQDSTLGKGSTFIITIAHGQQQMAAFSTGAQSNWSQTAASRDLVIPATKKQELPGLNVLVVDDSLDNLLFISKILTLTGAHVENANNGKEGIDKAMHGNFDVVLMDLQMPEMDGYEATKELRRLNYVKPIIALTAHAMKEERKRCLENGFDDHITKPVDRRFLIQTLSELQQKSKALNQAAEGKI